MIWDHRTLTRVIAVRIGLVSRSMSCSWLGAPALVEAVTLSLLVQKSFITPMLTDGKCMSAKIARLLVASLGRELLRILGKCTITPICASWSSNAIATWNWSCSQVSPLQTTAGTLTNGTPEPAIALVTSRTVGWLSSVSAIYRRVGASRSLVNTRLAADPFSVNVLDLGIAVLE